MGQKQKKQRSVLVQLVAVSLLAASFVISSGVLATRGKNTYKNTIVTKNNLYKLAPKPPEKLEKLVVNYYKNNPNQFKNIIVYGNPKCVQNNMGKSNIVRTFYGDHVEKVSGFINRWCLQVANQNLPYGQFNKIDKNKLLKETYQTASRMVGHLFVLESIKQRKLQSVDLPKSYLIDVTGGNSIDDKKTAFYEEKLSSEFKPISTFLNKPKLLSQLLPVKNFKEILYVCKDTGTCGGWDLNGKNLFINEKTGKITPVDLEQPNTTKPSQLFNCDWDDKKNPRHSRYWLSVISGLMSLYDTFVDYPNLLGEIEGFAKENEQNFYIRSNFKKLTGKFSKNK